MIKPILVFGDIILDKFTHGEIKRTNPEAPAPLFDIDKREYRLGGAANVANNLFSLNSNFYLYGHIGKDLEGSLLKSLAQNFNFYFIEDENPTTLKERFISETFRQQVFRADEEKIRNPTKKDIEEILSHLNSIESEMVIFSDYNKGFLTKQLVSKIKEKGYKILVDPKPKNIDLYHGVYLIKTNLKEAGEIYGHEILNIDSNIEEVGEILAKKYSSNLIITRGSLGSTLITKEGSISHIRQEQIKVFDVTGAGDTYIATLAFAMNELGKNLEEAIFLAQSASKLVVQKPGTATISRKELEL